jgi:dipeptidyl aminopeptidase/acylaminoacyl peptidase
MLRVRRFVALVGIVVAGGFPRAVGADAPVPLDYRAYDGWNAIRYAAISDDGRSLAYALTPEDGDPTLVVRDLETGAERGESRGTSPVFAASGRFVVFAHVAAKLDVDAAKKQKKPPDQQPHNGLGILDLRSPSAALIVDNIRSFAVARDGGPVIAYRAEPSPSPKSAASAPSATPSPQPSPTTAATSASSPTPSPSPTPTLDKTKDTGAPLVIRDLVAAKNLTVPNVTDYAVSADDRWIAYATETKDGKGDGLHLYDVAHTATIDIATGAGRYRDLAIARDGSGLAYLSDAASYAGPSPHDALYVVDLHAAHPVARVAADLSGAGMPANFAPSTNAALHFSRDGERVFVGTAIAPTPSPSNTPEPTKVDLWSWNDTDLQSKQKHDADSERKRTYAAVYDVTASRFAQLGAADLRDVETNDNPRFALGSDDRAYRRSVSWLGEDHADVYAVSLADGTRKLLASATTGATLSPAGGFALTWDPSLRHWIAISTATGRRVVLAPNADVRFDLEDDDHPAPPEPYGTGGWLSDDRGVLLYDRYDVWLASPVTGAAISLTHGAGRRTHTVFSPVQTDPDAEAFSVDAPILLSLIDDHTFASGFARVSPTGGVPTVLFERDEQVNGFRNPGGGNFHDLTRPPLAARHADRYVFSRETFRTFRNLWSSDASFAHLAQVTDANPQQAKYRWGTERLISFHSADGTPLRAVMLIPDGLKPDRSAPLLVYFYERWSGYLHQYYPPAPGTSPNFTRYVSNGYVVLLPDVRYRVGHPGASAVDAILPAVDVALRSGYIDEKHMGIAGHSWAAYQINYLITKTHRFRAAEAGAAVDDMFSAYAGIRLESGNVRESQYEHGQSRIGATPWDRPDLYLENSGLFGIKNVTTPYLTIANELDGAVPQFQGIEYITAMRRLGKVAYLFSFDGEDHNLVGRENQKYWTVHLDEWFDYWLKGAPRPSWMDGVQYLQRGERNVRPLYGEGP